MNFRRWFTALTLLVLCVGLASAQTPTQPPLTCTTGTGAVTPLLRGEGFTELVGDIVITCTGGSTTNLVAGTAPPTANIVVGMNLPVTSRILSTSTNAAETLLLIDEPGSGLAPLVAPYGPAASQVFCGNATVGAGVGGCAEFYNVSGGFPVMTSTAAGGTNGPNVFEGTVSGNQITFNGIPIIPPGTTGSRVFRITNVRVAAATSTSTAFFPVTASISTNGSTSLPLQNAVQTVGFVTASLTGSISNANTFSQCNSSAIKSSALGPRASTITFSEQFASAFKTRIAPQTNTAFFSQGSTGAQNIPGFLYNSESGFIFPSVTGTNTTAGLADFGTRLKATFVNIPAGISGIYVTVNNVLPSGTAPSTSGSALIGGTTVSPSYAQLVTGEAAINGSAAFGGTTGFPGVSGTVTGTSTTPNTSLAQVYSGTGTSATATWEVTNTNPSAIDSISFDVYVTYTANAANNQPIGTGQVLLTYAPTPTGLGISSTSAATALTGPIPRFTDNPSFIGTFLTVTQCQTVLLWPYVTTLTGFNTGFAISNTSVDPGSVIGSKSSGAQSGTCALYLYGTPEVSTMTMPTMPITVPLATESTKVIAGGTTYANDLASVFAAVSPNSPFSLAKGYMFGVCNFQYAHGYAAISDSKAANWVTSYLALIVAPAASGNRGTPAEQFIH